MTDLAQKLTPLPAAVWVACGYPDCTAFGIQRQIWLKQVAVGVVAFPRLLCVACRTDVQMFPDFQEAEVPKIHVGREPTDRADIVAAAPAPEPVELDADPAPADVEQAVEAPAAAKTTPARKGQPRKKAN